MKASRNRNAGIRQRLGLSQLAFAIELGISRSTLAMAETKSRHLPTKALLKLSALESCLGKMDNAETPMLPGRNSSKWSDEPSCCERVERWKQKFQKMISREEHLIQTLKNVERVLQTAVVEDWVSFNFTLFRLHWDTLMNKLSKCNKQPQDKLMQKIGSCKCRRKKP